MKIALGTPQARRYPVDMRPFIPFVVLLATAALADTAPPLSGVAIVSVASPQAGAEPIAPRQTETQRRHAPGPVTVTVEEAGIGGARLTMIDGAARTLPSTTRPLCGPQRAAGACRTGESIAGLEITYRLTGVASGQTFTFRDRSASGPGAPIDTAITIR